MLAAMAHARASSSLPVMSAAAARQLLLNGQGLLGTLNVPSRKKAIVRLAGLIDQLGFVQVDTINVVERAHHLTLWSRLPAYQPQQLKALLEDQRALFEHWTHDASIIPLKWYPHWRHRFNGYRSKIRTNEWWKQRIGEKPDRLIKAVRARIEKDGPLLSRDFEHRGKTEAWWGWKPQKAALEHLWRCGELAIAKRINFQKVYDLPQRVYPQQHQLAASNAEEHIDWACRTALERLGAATPGEIAGFWRAISPAQARHWCERSASQGIMEMVLVESADGSPPRTSYALRDWRERVALAHAANEITSNATRLLNPFDPVLRDRARTKRLFNFDYTFEAFVPAAKRKYGYFVMPLMEGDRLIARLDPKFHRDTGVLEIKSLWWEPTVRITKARTRAFNDTLQSLAEFIGASTVHIPR